MTDQKRSPLPPLPQLPILSDGWDGQPEFLASLLNVDYAYLELKAIAQLQRDNPTMLVILENMT